MAVHLTPKLKGPNVGDTRLNGMGKGRKKVLRSSR